ncbi:hypothetical protein L3Q82_007752 [Scortum barcoo]|uniref:Uncharacterized protein n=1 Tax=Scortum barcoo TaxID=214431 RepID=A0ACB8WP06_9TELE|nr:hypothetical protein L3Q82_007752 [Scortum barcoo]
MPLCCAVQKRSSPCIVLKHCQLFNPPLSSPAEQVVS